MKSMTKSSQELNLYKSMTQSSQELNLHKYTPMGKFFETSYSWA